MAQSGWLKKYRRNKRSQSHSSLLSHTFAFWQAHIVQSAVASQDCLKQCSGSRSVDWFFDRDINCRLVKLWCFVLVLQVQFQALRRRCKLFWNLWYAYQAVCWVWYITFENNVTFVNGHHSMWPQRLLLALFSAQLKFVQQLGHQFHFRPVSQPGFHFRPVAQHIYNMMLTKLTLAPERSMLVSSGSGVCRSTLLNHRSWIQIWYESYQIMVRMISTAMSHRQHITHLLFSRIALELRSRSNILCHDDLPVGRTRVCKRLVRAPHRSSLLQTSRLSWRGYPAWWSSTAAATCPQPCDRHVFEGPTQCAAEHQESSAGVSATDPFFYIRSFSTFTLELHKHPCITIHDIIPSESIRVSDHDWINVVHLIKWEHLL